MYFLINNIKKQYKVVKIDSFYSKLMNLILCNEFADEIVYLFSNTKGFNTLFLNFNIDVLILDENKRIIKIFQNIEPNKISDYFKDCFYIVFMKKKSIKINDIQNRQKCIFKYY